MWGPNVERQIREAQRRGDFDHLPGAGRPLDLGDPDDQDWWLKRFTRREGIDLSAVLHPTLALRREAERLPEEVLALPDERAVREVVEDFNARVRQDWVRPKTGPTPPLPARQLDVEAVLAGWAASRPPVLAPDPAPPVAPAAPRRRWWHRRAGSSEVSARPGPRSPGGGGSPRR